MLRGVPTVAGGGLCGGETILSLNGNVSDRRGLHQDRPSGQANGTWKRRVRHGREAGLILSIRKTPSHTSGGHPREWKATSPLPDAKEATKERRARVGGPVANFEAF